jgi:hypothetical protein
MRVFAFAAFVACVPTSNALAHCFVGARFFPATLNIDDPCVADELSLPTVSIFNTGDDPSAQQVVVAGEFSKRITSTFGISVGTSWTQLSTPGGPTVSGFQNVETMFKYQFLTVPAHELVMSVGLGIEWGATGSTDVGAERFTTFTPTFFFGKGFGDLPDSMGGLRPFAVTGNIGYAIPSSASDTIVTIDPDSGDQIIDVDTHPQFLVWGGSIQYSMPYLKSQVFDYGLPDFINRLVPIVEAQFRTPVANNPLGLVTTGTINPGVIWVGNYAQFAVEAIIPINRQSGTNVGVMAQLHLYLDDIFPNSIGRPIFGAAPPARRPF